MADKTSTAAIDIGRVYSGSTCKHIDVVKHLREIDAHLTLIRDRLQKEKSEMKTQTDEADAKIDQHMDTISALGQEKIAEIENIFKQESKTISMERDELTQSNELVTNCIKELEKARNARSEADIALAKKQAEKQYSAYKHVLDGDGQLTCREIDVELDNKIDSLTSIGSVTVQKSTIKIDHPPSDTELLNTEQSEKGICWFDLLPRDQVVLLSSDLTRHTSQLSLYRNDGRMLSQLDLPDTVSADLLTDHMVIVPVFSDKSLHTVTIDQDKLVRSDTIRTKLRPGQILKFSDTALLISALSDGLFCFQILNLNGEVIQHLPVGLDLKKAGFMRLSQDKKTIYVVDNDKGCFGFNLQGDVVFTFWHFAFCIYFGLALDQDNCVYLSARKGDQGLNYVVKLSPEGVILRTLDIRKKFPVRCIGNKLYLAGANEQNEGVISSVYI